MKQINWQDPFQGNALEEDIYAERKARNYSQPISYTDRFRNNRKKVKNEFQKDQKKPSSFRESYIQTEQNNRVSHQINDEVRGRTVNPSNYAQKPVSDSAVNKPDSNNNESISITGATSPVFLILCPSLNRIPGTSEPGFGGNTVIGGHRWQFKPPRGFPFFPLLLTGLIEIGENTGNLQENLTYLAEYYQEETELKIQDLTTLIEPLMLLVMGLLVGFDVKPAETSLRLAQCGL